MSVKTHLCVTLSALAFAVAIQALLACSGRGGKREVAAGATTDAAPASAGRVATSSDAATRRDASASGAAGARNATIDAGAPGADAGPLLPPPGVGCGASDAGLPQASGAALPLGTVCSSDAWCWQRPLPQGNSLVAIWGLGSDDVWAVGGQGTALHYDGRNWSGSTAVTGSRTFADVHGSASNDVWMAGDNGALAHWDGAALHTAALDGGIFYLVRAVGPSEVWLCGDGLARWNGSALSPFMGKEYASCKGLWPAARDDVWLNDGSDQRWNGSKWNSVPYPKDVLTLGDLWASASADVWQLGGANSETDTVFHWNGSAWTNAYRAPVALTRITGSGAGNVWARSQEGVLFHYDGAAWTRIDSGFGERLAGFFSAGSADAWASTLGPNGASPWDYGGGSLYRWDGKTFARFSDAPIDAHATAIWAAAPDDVWIAWSDATLLHFDGTSWRPVVIDGAPTILALFANSRQDLWAAGSAGSFFHWNGCVFTRVPAPGQADIVALSGSGSADVWAVAGSGELLHWNGQAWYRFAQPSGGSATQIAVIAKDEIILLGRDQLVHGDGRSFSPIPDAPPNAHALSVGGAGAVWVLAGMPNDPQHEAAARWDGQHWSFVPVASSVALSTLLGVSADDAWIIDATNQAWHWDGKTLASSALGAGPKPTLIAASSADDLWIAGEQGMILHRGTKR